MSQIRGGYYFQSFTFYISFGITNKSHFFRNVNATKVKALKKFDEGEKPESLVGYVNERDGNGIELFEKIYDR